MQPPSQKSSQRIKEKSMYQEGDLIDGRTTSSTITLATSQNFRIQRSNKNQSQSQDAIGSSRAINIEQPFEENAQSIFPTEVNFTNELSLFSKNRANLSLLNSQQYRKDQLQPIVFQSELRQITSMKKNADPDSVKKIRLKKFQNYGLHGKYLQQSKNRCLEASIRQKDEYRLADEAQEKTLKKELLSDGAGIETVDQVIRSEKQHLEDMNDFLAKRVFRKQAIDEVGSPKASPNSNSRSPIQRRGSIRKSTAMGSPVRLGRRCSSMFGQLHPALLGSAQSSPAFRDKKQPVKDLPVFKKDTLVGKFRYANEQLETVTKADFYKSMRNFRSIQMYQELYEQKDNIYTSVINSAVISNQIPKAFPLIPQETRQIQTVSVSRGGSNALRHTVSGLSSPQCEMVNTVDISKNRLGVEMLSQFLKTLPKPVNNLNLSGGCLDLKSIMTLAEFLKKPNEMKYLNLEQNKFSDKGCIKLVESIPDSHQLRSLNLSKNRLTSSCCEAIASLLRRTQFLRELYLHFNNINQHGGAVLFKALQKCRPLKVIDLSYNTMGNQGEFHQLSTKKMHNLQDNKNVLPFSDCIQNLVKFITKTSEVVHIDLSYNKFTLAETQEIQKALKSNQSIFGFHFEGNQPDMVIDVLGFLQQNDILLKSQLENSLPDAQRYEGLTLNCDNHHHHHDTHKTQEPENKALNSIEQFSREVSQFHRHRRIDGVKPVKENTQYKGISTLDTCWICEGWQEIKLVWHPQRSGKVADQPLFLHSNVNQYKPLLMTKLYEEFFCFIMCPPNFELKYFFTNPVMGILSVARDQLIMDLEENDVLRKPQVIVYNGNIIVDSPPQRQINYLYTTNDGKVLDDQLNYVPSIYARPREDQKKFDFTPYLGKVNRGWALETSIFNNFRVDNEMTLEECFQFDFESSKIARLVKDEAETVQELLLDYYPLLFNSYKYYCSFGSIYNLPCISMSTFYDLLSNTTIMEGGRVKSTDIDVLFVSSNGKDQNYPQVFEKAIVRYQYMELIVRIALDKYYKSGLVKAASLAIMKLFENDALQDWLQEFDSAQDWRDHRFWNEANDKLLTTMQPFIRQLFRYTAQINPKTKYYKNQWVSAVDFRDLMLQVGAVGEHLSEKEVYHAYLMSMMTEVDELFQARHYQMNYYEFIEGIARIAEKLSVILPVQGQIPTLLLQLTHQEKLHYDLYRKLQGFLMNIYFKLADKIKETFKSSPDDDYFKIDSCMMSEKNYRKLMQRQLILPQQAQMLRARNQNTPLLPDVSQFQATLERSKSSSSSSSNSSLASSSDSDKSLELQTKEYIIGEQLKDQQKIQGKKNLSSLMRGAVNKIKQEKFSTTFSLSSIVKFLQRQNEEQAQTQKNSLKSLGIF